MFVECDIVAKTYNVLSRWMELDFSLQVGVTNIVTCIDSLHVLLIKKYVINVILMTTCQVLWRFLNDDYFNSSICRQELSFIQLLIFLFCSLLIGTWPVMSKGNLGMCTGPVFFTIFGFNLNLNAIRSSITQSTHERQHRSQTEISDHLGSNDCRSTARVKCEGMITHFHLLK